MAWMAPSIPALRPAQNLSDPQTKAALIRVAMQTALPITLHNVSPIPIGRTPGHLLRAIKREATNALISSQGTIDYKYGDIEWQQSHVNEH